MSASERDKKVYDILKGLFEKGRTSNEEFTNPFRKEEVESLFNTHIWGHREITLTIIIARILNDNFQASKDFYSCNPRAIYEKPIRKVFREFGIPHKKSGPLNVAKNIQKIDYSWANNKRGDGIAKNVVNLVQQIEFVSKQELQNFGIAFCKRYLKEAQNVVDLNFTPEKQEDPLFLTKLSKDLIENVPDGGSIPQIIIGLLLEANHHNKHSSVSLTGHLDSVSTTNTTSKKPGDAIEKFHDNYEFIYEVTVKKFDCDRIKESFEAVREYNSNSSINEVIVICRKKDVPDDIITHTGSGYILGTLGYQDIIYYFIDIYEWIREKILFLTPGGRIKYYNSLVDNINEINTSKKVKVYFKQWHKRNQS